MPPVADDDAGVPPEVIDENWLWVEFHGELLGVDVDGGYELEPVAGAGPPWLYRTGSGNVAGPGAEPGGPRFWTGDNAGPAIASLRAPGPVLRHGGCRS